MWAAIIFTGLDKTEVEQVLAPFDEEEDAIDEALEYTDNINKISVAPLLLFDDESDEEE